MPRRVRVIAAALAGVEIWPAIALVASGAMVTRTLPIALAIMGVFWLIRWLGYGHPSIRTPADWAIALLVLMLPITLWVTAWPATTTPQVYRLLSGIALFYAIVNWAISPARLQLLISGTSVIGVLLALLAPVSVFWGSSRLSFVPRSLYTRVTVLLADTINANVMAGTLVILLPSVLALLLFGWQEDGWLRRILGSLAALTILGMLLLSQSRGALLALAGALLVMTLLRWRRGWLALLALIGLGVVAVRTLGGAMVLDALATGQSFNGYGERLEIWRRAVYMIQDFPFTGIGMGSFKEVIDAIYPLFFNSDNVLHSHNLFFQVGVDLGIPGLIAWLSVVIVITASAWQVYYHGRLINNGSVTGLGAGLLASQVALLVHGITDAVTWGMVRPAVVPWALWGMAIAARSVYVLDGAQSREHARPLIQPSPGSFVIERHIPQPPKQSAVSRQPSADGTS